MLEMISFLFFLVSLYSKYNFANFDEWTFFSKKNCSAVNQKLIKREVYELIITLMTGNKSEKFLSSSAV